MLLTKSYQNFVRFIVKKMSSLSFVQTLNPLNKKMEWKVIDDDYDYNQEIATSSYGDMLHDDERNKKFGEALRKAIQKFHSQGKKANVLDIGTGTGLLSMLAVKYGADSVTACEAFLPMANCAIKIIEENNFSNKIKIVKSHSTELIVGKNGELKQKANILISEVFDTELIGEGAIKTFNHAFKNLLTDDAVVIPSKGIIYAQVIESDMAQKWNELQDWVAENEVMIKIPKIVKDCPGVPAVHDIQLSEFNEQYFKALSNPIPVFRFDWAKNKEIPTFEQKINLTNAISHGKAQVVFMWWDLIMDEEGEIVISCAPVWEHPISKDKGLEGKALTKLLPWRDHWMQAVYFLPFKIDLKKNDPFTLLSQHDEFSFWFHVEKDHLKKSLEISRPVCNCCFHFLLSRSRIGAINDQEKRNNFFRILKESVTNKSVCVILGDFSLLALMAAKLGAKKVYTLVENESVKNVFHMLSVENNLKEKISFLSDISQIISSLIKDFKNESLDVIILSEIYFRNSILPWDNLLFWYLKTDFVNSLKNVKVVKSVKTIPIKCKVKGCAVEFDNLWRIATPLKTCEEFSMKIFDDLIQKAKEKTGQYVEAQPLWEYPGTALSASTTILEFDFADEVPTKKIIEKGNFELKCSGKCNGIALWMEYNLNSDVSISLGPTENIVVNEYISWNPYERQGVHIFRNSVDFKKGDAINYTVEFDPGEAEIKFFFDYK